MLIPNGVYLTDIDPPYFRALPAPSVEELQALVQRIAERLGKHLERRGLLVALGFHGAPSGIDSQPAGELDPIPRGFRAEPPLKGKGRAWPGKARWGRTRDPSAAARLDGMGEAIEGGIRD